MKLIWAVSGRGMAARAVMEAHLAGLIESKLDMVVFDRIGATDTMIEYCEHRRIQTNLLAPANLESQLLELQQAHHFDCMGLTFNRILPTSVIDAFQSQIINLHFSLLPALPGFGATRKALTQGLSSTGVTVHFIDSGIDTGPIIAQRKVEIEKNDNEATLGRRQFEAAVPLVLQAIRQIERKSRPSFDHPDDDIARFATEYCNRFVSPPRSESSQGSAG
jgi:phosphoribosylglycinamide formyltransferase 1